MAQFRRLRMQLHVACEQTRALFGQTLHLARERHSARGEILNLRFDPGAMRGERLSPLLETRQLGPQARMLFGLARELGLHPTQLFTAAFERLLLICSRLLGFGERFAVGSEARFHVESLA